jgi:CMP-N-acetylneuraminic acid synthetase
LGQQTQYGVLLEPTAPLRTPDHILSALDILKSSDADSVVSVSQIPHIFNPEEILVIDDQALHPFSAGRTLDNRLPRGKQTPHYVQNGLVYAFRLDMLLKKKSLYGDKCLPLIVDWNYFLDIDSPPDLDFAEYKINSLNKNTGRK